MLPSFFNHWNCTIGTVHDISQFYREYLISFYWTDDYQIRAVQRGGARGTCCSAVTNRAGTVKKQKISRSIDIYLACGPVPKFAFSFIKNWKARTFVYSQNTRRTADYSERMYLRGCSCTHTTKSLPTLHQVCNAICQHASSIITMFPLKFECLLILGSQIIHFRFQLASVLQVKFPVDCFVFKT